MKSRALLVAAHDLDVSAVQLDELLDDHQPDSRAAGAETGVLLDLIETFEYVREVAVGNADARVGHHHLDVAGVLAPQADEHLPLFGGEFDGVGDEVDENFVDFVGVETITSLLFCPIRTTGRFAFSGPVR